MSLHVIIGFDSPGATAVPYLVYLGRSGVEARTAMAESKALRFEVLQNVTGIRKHNPHADANRAAVKKGKSSKAKPTPPPAPAAAAASKSPVVAVPPPATLSAPPPPVEDAEDGDGENHFAT